MPRRTPARRPTRLAAETTLSIRDSCLCLHVQRAARSLARLYDDAFRELGITHGQFSLLNALNRPSSACMGDVARLLGMDPTTLSANVKPLQRAGLLRVSVDEVDRRARRLALTADGHALLTRAVPIWKRTHARLERLTEAPEQLRADLLALSHETAAG